MTHHFAAGGAAGTTTTVDAALVDVLGRAERLVTGRLTGLLVAGGSTLDEWRVLSLLARRGGQSMSAIAAASLVAPPTLTKRIDGMVADGLVHRRVDDADRRRVLVLLAPRGRAAHRRLAGRVLEEERRLAELAAGAGVDVERVARLIGELLVALEGTGDLEPEGPART